MVLYVKSNNFVSNKLVSDNRKDVIKKYHLESSANVQSVKKGHPFLSNAKVVAQSIQNAVVVNRGGRKVSLLLQ